MRYYPMFNNKGESKMSNEKTLDNIIINAKVIALMELKEKITKEIVDLETKREDKDEIPF